jgi:hypothetical protein
MMPYACEQFFAEALATLDASQRGELSFIG